MKSFPFFTLLLCLALTSCKKFIDEVQDNRTLIDSEDKVAKLLVNAYPNAQYSCFAESMSDNADDKGIDGKVTGDQAIINKEAYQWKDYESITALDAPANFWTACYNSIAQANQALASLEKLGTKTARTSSLRAEALIARAYSHFMIANFFALRYDPATAATTEGIPYITAPEQNAIVPYHRETMEETFRLIEKDLTEGLPFITNNYEKPKYHFNVKASHAFAARFYLYKGEWEKVIEHASLVLGDGPPESVIRDLVSPSYTLLQFTEKAVGYSAAAERANLLIGWTNSKVARYFPFYRYGLAASKSWELFSRLNPFQKAWAYLTFTAGNDNYALMAKYEEYFSLENPSAGTGYPFTSLIHFTTDEALLNRAEAYSMLNKFEEASKDLTSFLSLKTDKYSAATDKVTPELMSTRYPVVEGEYTPFYTLTSDQASYIKGIAEFRRREFCQEGFRWFDVKRFNLKIIHQQVNGPTIVLPKDDPRRAIQIPEAAKAFGIKENNR